MSAQWVALRSGETLIASSRGAWIQAPQAAALELRGSMPPGTPATLETTRHLLDGAIAAAERGAAPADQWPPTVSTWALGLVDQWYTAHHSVALLPAAVQRYEAMGRLELATFARLKLEEEAGHDLLPLADVRALGYDADAVVRKVRPGRTAREAVQFARDCVRAPSPVAFLGYIYALERRVIRIDEEALRALEGALPSGVQAASGVRAHALEFDREHVEELVRFISDLPAGDRADITIACHATASILAAAPPANDEHELERERELARCQRQSQPLQRQSQPF